MDTSRDHISHELSKAGKDALLELFRMVGGGEVADNEHMTRGPLARAILEQIDGLTAQPVWPDRSDSGVRKTRH